MVVQNNKKKMHFLFTLANQKKEKNQEIRLEIHILSQFQTIFSLKQPKTFLQGSLVNHLPFEKKIFINIYNNFKY